ncbi:MAG: 2Fe-2S iron-sulfur cluster binding protein [Chitinophagaceae bacterium]|nr:2Fe-2S iron-sulfur cluster binding protein [Chitinophagaceae bacterium]
MIQFILNDKETSTDLPPGELLLDLIRYHKHLMGTKIGCREGDCGACTVLIGETVNSKLRYRSVTSCLTALGNVQGKHVVTVEGLNLEVSGQGTEKLNPVQHAMYKEGATQCGFCTPGFIVSLAGFCLSDSDKSYENAIASIDGNICRCTGYKSIQRAAKNIAELMQQNKGDVIEYVTSNSILPEYFSGIKKRLLELNSKTNGIEKQTADPKKYLGGGTDLYVQQHEKMVHADIDFLFNKIELNGIKKEGNKCILGASVTITDLMESKTIKDAFPDFRKVNKLVSSTPIRNIATIAGNFVNASPIGDLTILFLALNARIVVSNEISKREIPLREFYKGYKQLDKREEEFIEQIWFELPDKDHLFNFEKVSKRTHLDIASVNSALSITMNGKIISEAGLSAGGVGPIPMFLSKTSAFLKDKKISEQLVNEAIEIAQSEISPISDARGSEEYKRLLLSQLIKAHFITLFPKVHLNSLFTNAEH